MSKEIQETVDRHDISPTDRSKLRWRIKFLDIESLELRVKEWKKWWKVIAVC